MVFNFIGNQRSIVEMQSSYIQHDDTIQRVRGAISIKDEYKSQIGHEYREQHRAYGTFAIGKNHIRNADIKAAERMYVAGYARKATINTIMRNSPMTANMTPMQKLAYREKIGRYMKKVEPLRQQVDRHKQQHGITSNRVKDMNDYGRVVQAQQRARHHRAPVKPMTYQEFIKDGSHNTHVKYEQQTNQAIHKKKQQEKPVKQAQKTAEQAIKQPYRHKL